MNSCLFEPVNIGRLRLINRFVRSATHDYLADDQQGYVGPAQLELYRKLAEGEIGLIITGHAYVHPSGKASPRQIAVDDDRKIPGLARLAEAVHQTGSGSRVFLQIAHAGRQTRPALCRQQPVAPSAVYDPVSRVLPRELTVEEIHQVIYWFVKAAQRARQAGFDGVQLHAGHGYLLSSFISPHTNRRTDDWGGNWENRSRIIREIISGIGQSCGPDFPVIIKMNATDHLPDGLTLEEAMKIALSLEQAGLQAIEISGGMNEAGLGSVWPGLRAEEQEGYFVPLAASIKKVLKIPVMGLGGIRTYRVAEKLVSSGQVDLISMSRPFINHPELIKDFRSGRLEKSPCLSCNQCFNPRGIRCQPKKT
ncbi:MAG: NADH:flavin oxidoreductase [Candidatus Saccharicenans sp.]|jgi:2,4-dienoyl-CoA reductase-like NADH-dependent reductase (Old Yellow Enzyme family)|nr:NADH:flavin oxidoreductase [Candidatus Saccharicenans sp.]MDH7493582.1 NADH:flavin oxidoreductase [Candidatus Saccharicenans sp.]